MRSRLVLASLTLALAPFGAGGADATEATEAFVMRPAYLNIVIDSPVQPGQPPRWRVETLPVGEITPEVSCRTDFPEPPQEGEPVTTFAVECVAITQPPGIDVEGGGQVVHIREGWGCGNPGVRASISGPIPGESVTGRVICGHPDTTVAQCTAVAATLTLPSGYSGNCAQVGPSNYFPARCEAIVNARFDTWSVTCMTSDP